MSFVRKLSVWPTVSGSISPNEFFLYFCVSVTKKKPNSKSFVDIQNEKLQHKRETSQ